MRLLGATFFSARTLRIERTISCIKAKSAVLDASQPSGSRGLGHFAIINALGQSDAIPESGDWRMALLRWPQISSVTNGVKGCSKRKEISNTRANVSAARAAR